jgi:hypothetical protein
VNRFFRRLQRYGKSPEDREEQPQLHDAGTPPDVSSVRAMSAGHKKKTADKWNQ